jgi:hypothetical protein
MSGDFRTSISQSWRLQQQRCKIAVTPSAGTQLILSSTPAFLGKEEVSAQNGTLGGCRGCDSCTPRNRDGGVLDRDQPLRQSGTLPNSLQILQRSEPFDSPVLERSRFRCSPLLLLLPPSDNLIANRAANRFPIGPVSHFGLLARSFRRTNTPAVAKEPSMSEWHYSKNNQQQGPVSAEQLKQLAASGQLNPSDLVWKEGMGQWTEARKIKGLFPMKTVLPSLSASSSPARPQTVASSITTPLSPASAYSQADLPNTGNSPQNFVRPFGEWYRTTWLSGKSSRKMGLVGPWTPSRLRCSYPLMQQPRAVLRRELRKHCT